jgi:sugar transferase (PEP-CTERM system associated)
MVKLFSVYYPIRTIVLLLTEIVVVASSFLIAASLVLGPDVYLELNYEGGALKILAVTVISVFCSYYIDLYAPRQLPSRSEIYLRLLAFIGTFSIVLAIVSFVYPGIDLGKNVLLIGLLILTIALCAWRSAYEWVITRPILSERVFVLGAGEEAQRTVEIVSSRPDLGMRVVGWGGALGRASVTIEDYAAALHAGNSRGKRIDRVIVALQERRLTMPVRELLDLRLAGVKVENSTDVLEKIDGKIHLDGLHPSTLIFSEGFRLHKGLLMAHRIVSIMISLTVLLICLPAIPVVALLIKLTSPGPVFFRQERVGLRAEVFTVYKFRTMRQDAECETGPVWAQKQDPRITPLGSFLRKTRLDELPQLWNVLKGDMSFVGPRPERPEFVSSLSAQIPYYNLRNIIPPGLTGWAQVRYRYGATVEDAKRKLEYDLYYIKHMSIALDLLIIFETVKTVVFGRGQ